MLLSGFSPELLKWRVAGQLIYLVLHDSKQDFVQKGAWAVSRPHPFDPVGFNILSQPFLVLSGRITASNILLKSFP